jgi:hypothetical protein
VANDLSAVGPGPLGVEAPQQTPDKGHGSGKRTRVRTAAIVVAAHVLLIHALVSLSITHPDADALTAPPIHVSLIEQLREPSFSRPSRLSRPRLAAFRIALPQLGPEFRVPAPAVQAPSAGPATHVTGSPAVQGQIGRVGAPPRSPSAAT